MEASPPATWIEGVNAMAQAASKRVKMQDDASVYPIVPVASKLDTSSLSAQRNDEVGNFNVFYYFYKGPEFANPQKYLFVKHSEISLILKQAYEKKKFLLFSYTVKSTENGKIKVYNDRNGNPFYDTYGFWVESSGGSYVLNKYYKQSTKKYDVSGSLTALMSNPGRRLLEDYEFDINPSQYMGGLDKLMESIFYMAVKYEAKLAQIVADDPAEKVETYEQFVNDIVRVCGAVQHQRTKEYYEEKLEAASRTLEARQSTVDSAREDLLLAQQRLESAVRNKNEQEQKCNALLVYQIATPLMARLAYERNLSPENPEIRREALQKAQQMLGVTL